MTDNYREVRDRIRAQAGDLATLISGTNHNGRPRPPAATFTEPEVQAPAEPAPAPDLWQGPRGPHLDSMQAKQMRLDADDLGTQEREGIMREILTASAGQLVELHRKMNGA